MLSTVLSILIILLVFLLFFAAILIFRSSVYGRLPAPIETREAGNQVVADPVLVAEHLASTIRLETISDTDRGKINLSAFTKMHTALERMYPRLHATLQREKINDYSLLYTWIGRAAEQAPVMLMAHLDVVPVDPSTQDEWTHPPFAGTVDDGYVWGRGALDIKSGVITIMEAVEGLIKIGYQPERTLYLAFGHDEEIGGLQGAQRIVETLEQRGVHLAAVIDEGSAVGDGLLPEVRLPVGLIGIAEKGYASVQLTVEGRPGHSSIPSSHTSIGILAKAITRLEANPMPVRLDMARLLFKDLCPFLPFKFRLAISNLWLFEGQVKMQLQRIPAANAMIRTTIAATMIQGGVKDNILPARVSAVLNCRILPGDTLVQLMEHIRKVIDDEAVQINLIEGSSWEASTVSAVDSPVSLSLSNTIRQVFPEAIVAPCLVTGATDSRFFVSISDHVYRFSPYRITPDLLKSVHGVDERIAVDGLAPMVQFYSQLIQSWTTIVGVPQV